MPAIHFTEGERLWLERFAVAYRIHWLYRKVHLEAPPRGEHRPASQVPVTYWKGRDAK